MENIRSPSSSVPPVLTQRRAFPPHPPTHTITRNSPIYWCPVDVIHVYVDPTGNEYTADGSRVRWKTAEKSEGLF